VPGEGVEGSWVGREVLALTRFGGYADVVCVPVKQVFSRPSDMSALEAAAIPVNYFTAWQLVVVMGALKPRETILVHSAGGWCRHCGNTDRQAHRRDCHRYGVCRETH
jgi:synaptic vesicle membrane protein VAT-1